MATRKGGKKSSGARKRGGKGTKKSASKSKGRGTAKKSAKKSTKKGRRRRAARRKAALRRVGPRKPQNEQPLRKLPAARVERRDQGRELQLLRRCRCGKLRGAGNYDFRNVGYRRW